MATHQSASVLESYPYSDSRKLILNQLASALENQDRTYESVVLGIQGWLALATAITGIGITFGLTQIPDGLRLDWVPLLVAALPGVFYLAYVVLAWKGLRRDGIQLLQHPGWMRDNIAPMRSQYAESELLVQTEAAYLRNEAVLERKLRFLFLLRLLAPVLTMAVLGYVAWTTGIKIICDCG